jgi:FlaG/FlaF family flagellin (archaellin)
MWVSQLGVWNTNSPVILGQYPALALMYRRGDVKEGEPAVVEHIAPETLYANQPVALPEKQYKDFVWKAELGGDPTVEFESKLDPRAFFTGPVRLNLHSGKNELQTANLDELINGANGVIHNTNGQLRWNYGKGYVLVDTSTSQGATGFLKDAGAIQAENLTITSGNEYGAIVAVALDDKPLADSTKILIQAVTRDKPYGYETQETGDGALKITSLGGYPLNVEKIDATVTLKGLADRKVIILDELGYPTERQPEIRQDGEDLIITLPEDSLYTLVTTSS